MKSPIKRFPIRYKEGEHLDSRQVRRLCGQVTDLAVPVGSKIEIPHQLEKLIVTEAFNQLVIDRVFVRYMNRKEWIPVYCKHYDVDSAHVLIYPEGVKQILADLSGSKDRILPMRRILTECSIEECLAIDPYMADVIRKPDGNLPIIDDEVTLLSSSLEPIGLEGYPWIMNDLSKWDRDSLHKKETKYHWSTANQLYDLWVQEGTFPDYDLRIHPVNVELQLLEEPAVGREFQHLYLDPVTEICSYGDQLSGKWISSNVRKLQCNPAVANVNGKIPFRPLKEFSSEILNLCVWVHRLQFHEFSLTYILPNRELKRLERFNYCDYTSRYHQPWTDVDHCTLYEETGQVFSTWNSRNVVGIELLKLANDELYLTITKIDGTVDRFFIDLTITTILSQCLAKI